MSSAFVSESNAQIAEFAVIYLVTVIEVEPDGTETVKLRLCTDAVDFESRGDTFTACGDALGVEMYEEREDVPPRGRLRLTNLTAAAIVTLRSLDPQHEAQVLVELVTSDEPDTVQASWEGAAIRDVTYDSLTLECEVAADNVVGIGSPALSFTPALFPAMHAKGR